MVSGSCDKKLAEDAMSRFKYEIEALLAEPVELWAGTVYAMAAVLILTFPKNFMLIPSLSIGISAVLLLLSFLRLKDGIYVWRYQRVIKKLPSYTLGFKDLPVSNKFLFLGRGFEWERKHLQRVDDLVRMPEYAEQSALYHWARHFEMQHESTPVLKYLAHFLGSENLLNPIKPLPPVGGLPYLHGVGVLEERNIAVALGDRVGHHLVLGTTRQGKTRLAESLIAQDISRGEIVIVMDPKGDADLLKRVYVEARRAGRLRDLYVFHLGFPERSAKYSPIGSYERITEVASRLANAVPSEGNASSFQQFVWRYVNGISVAAQFLDKKLDYKLIRRYTEDYDALALQVLTHFLDIKGHDWQAKVANYEKYFDDPDNKAYSKWTMGMMDRKTSVVARIRYINDFHKFGDLLDNDEEVVKSVIKTVEYDRKYYDKLIASLLPLLEKLTTGPVADIISPRITDASVDSSNQKAFTFKEIIRKGGIVYAGFDALTDPDVATAVSESMLADLTSTAGAIYKSGAGFGLPSSRKIKRKIALHADEINELMGDRFIPMVNKAGGAGVQVTGYTQTLSDIVAKLKDHAKAGQVIGNFNQLTMLRVQEPATAELLSEKVSEAVVSQITHVSRTQDSSDPDSQTHFTSTTEQRVTTERKKLIETSMLTNLPKGQAFALLNGSTPYKLRFPLPDQSDFSGIPEDIEEMSEQMREIYGSANESWYQFRLNLDYSNLSTSTEST